MIRSGKLVGISLFCFVFAFGIFIKMYINSIPSKKESVLMESIIKSEDVLIDKINNHEIPMGGVLSLGIGETKVISDGIINGLLNDKNSNYLFFDKIKRYPSIVKTMDVGERGVDGIKIFYQKNNILTDIVLKNNVHCYEIVSESNVIFEGLKIDKVKYCYLQNDLAYAQITTNKDVLIEDYIKNDFISIYSIEKTKDLKITTIKSSDLEVILSDFKMKIINRFDENNKLGVK